MSSFSRILFPVDFSERCRAAAPRVHSLAEAFGAELQLLHVVESPLVGPGEFDIGALALEADINGRLERASGLLDAFAESAVIPAASAGAVAVKTEVRRRVELGDPARVIVRVAQEAGADVIAMPTHGYGAFRRFVLGSVTAKVLHDSEAAVWTGVHMEALPAGPLRIRRILCALDLTPASDRPLLAAARVASVFGAAVALLHVVPGPEAGLERYLDSEMRAGLINDARERLAAEAARAGLHAEITVQAGEIAKEVHAAATQFGADLVVIGRGVHPGITGRLRTHSYAIIRESPCPVLSV